MLSGDALADFALSEAPAEVDTSVAEDTVWTCQTGDGEVWTCL